MTATRTADVIARELETANRLAAASSTIVANGERAWTEPTDWQRRLLAVGRGIAARHALRARAAQAEMEAAVSAELAACAWECERLAPDSTDEEGPS